MKKQRSGDPARRRFLRDVLRSTGGLAGMALLLGLQQRQLQAEQGVALRPPGALPEAIFNQACIRCGQCVQVCPYQTLRLATLLSDKNAGTPYFIARQIPCEMCEDIPCVAACPSGALDPRLTDIDQAQMGLAVLLDHENCLSWQGLRCEVCFDECPLTGKAITLERYRNPRTGKHARFLPTVHSEHCTGCGVCEKKCVLPTAAIKVLPRELAQGKLGEHYRLGWQEKQQAGQALIPEGLTLPVRRPGEE